MRLLFIGLLFFGTSCKKALPPEKASGEHIYTLYRGGAILKSVRINVATFETIGENITFNMENCELVASILNETQKNIPNPVKFWCEKGEYKE